MDRNDDGKITFRDFKLSTFMQALDKVNEEEDINTVSFLSSLFNPSRLEISFHMSISMYFIVSFGSLMKIMIFILIKKTLVNIQVMLYQEKLLIKYLRKSQESLRVRNLV